MKKLLGIVVLGLMLSGNAYAEDVTEQNKALLKMLCSDKTLKKSQKLIENCKKYFPTNNVQKQKEYICNVKSASTDGEVNETTKLKILKIYRGHWVAISEINPKLDNIEMVYFGNIIKSNDSIVFFSIDRESRAVVISNLKMIEGERQLVKIGYKLNDAEYKEIAAYQTLFDKEFSKSRIDLVHSELNTEIKMNESHMSTYNFIYKDKEKFKERFIGAYKYSCGAI